MPYFIIETVGFEQALGVKVIQDGQEIRAGAEITESIAANIHKAGAV